MTELTREEFANLTSELLERMDAQLAEWATSEPRDLWWQHQTDYAQARDTILAMPTSGPTGQDDVVKELVEALERMVYETTHLSPLEDDGSHWCRIGAETLAAARAALTKARTGVTLNG